MLAPLCGAKVGSRSSPEHELATQQNVGSPRTIVLRLRQPAPQAERVLWAGRVLGRSSLCDVSPWSAMPHPCQQHLALGSRHSGVETPVWCQRQTALPQTGASRQPRSPAVGHHVDRELQCPSHASSHLSRPSRQLPGTHGHQHFPRQNLASQALQSSSMLHDDGQRRLDAIFKISKMMRWSDQFFFENWKKKVKSIWS